MRLNAAATLRHAAQADRPAIGALLGANPPAAETAVAPFVVSFIASLIVSVAGAGDAGGAAAAPARCRG